MLEEISLNCPLREDEAAGIKKDYETASTSTTKNRPPLFVQGLIPPLFCAFEAGTSFFFLGPRPIALHESLRAPVGDRQAWSPRQIARAALKIFTDPFFPGDILNRLAREPGRLEALGYESFRVFLKRASPFSYGRSRFLMRLAAAIPAQNRLGSPAITANFF